MDEKLKELRDARSQYDLLLHLIDNMVKAYNARIEKAETEEDKRILEEEKQKKLNAYDIQAENLLKEKASIIGCNIIDILNLESSDVKYSVGSKVLLNKPSDEEDLSNDGYNEVESINPNVVEEILTPTKTDITQVQTSNEIKVVDTKENFYTTFDFSSIDPTVKYDIIPLPSNGQCYKHKKGVVPVAYVTASDENLFFSPNLYHSGKFIDILLKRKILDKDFVVEDLCVADKDAIILFLRGDAYGVNIPLTVKDPKNPTKHYDVTVDITKFNCSKTDLIGDENGWFDYTTSNGDLIKFNFLTHNETKVIEELSDKEKDLVNINIIKNSINTLYNKILSEESNNKTLVTSVENIKYWSENLDVSPDEEYVGRDITLPMLYCIKSVNGNTDKTFIEKYVNNIRSLEAYNLREYIRKNTPMYDFTFDVQRPGRGGSFKSFLSHINLIFLRLPS